MYDENGALTKLPYNAAKFVPVPEFLELQSRGPQGVKEYIKKRIFYGGCAHDIRPISWNFLLGVFPWESTELERGDMREKTK